MSNSAQTLPSSIDARKRRLSVLARAPEGALTTLFDSFAAERPVPEHTVLRTAEVGTAMVRARAGGSGAPFNLGEMTVTRMSVRLHSGAVGHGYVQGRSTNAVRMVALLDAMAEAGLDGAVDHVVVTPLEKMTQSQRATRAAKAAATKVEFFTMVRGEG